MILPRPRRTPSEPRQGGSRFCPEKLDLSPSEPPEPPLSLKEADSERSRRGGELLSRVNPVREVRGVRHQLSHRDTTLSSEPPPRSEGGSRFDRRHR